MRTFAVFAGLVVCSSTAVAQQIVPGQDVSDRPHAEYDQIGIEAHGFTLLPSVTTTIAATDNYRATRTNRQANIGLLLRPDLTWRSNWGRHRVDGDVFFEQRINAPLHHENGNSYGVSTNGVYEFSRDTYVRVGVAAQRLLEPRGLLGGFQDSVEPIHYRILRADTTLSKTFMLLQLQANANVESRRYDDAVLPHNIQVSQRYRDIVFSSFGGTADYDLENGISLLVTGQYSRSRYPFGPGSAGFIPGVSLDRDSSGVRVEGGVDLQLSTLVFGNLQAGYLRRSYVDPRLRDVSGVSFDGNLSWNVTPLTTFVASGRRWVEESASVVSEGNVRTDFKLGVHHELYRYVLLTGEVSYGRFKPVGLGSSGSEYGASVGVRYLVNRRATVNALIRYARRTSHDPYLPYNAVTAQLSLRYGL